MVRPNLTYIAATTPSAPATKKSNSSLKSSRRSANKTTRTAVSPSKPKPVSRTIIPGFVPDMLYLPRTVDAWPWQRTVNPACDEARRESNEWFYAFHPFSPEALRAFDKCDLGLLAALAYPTISKEQLRSGCDLMNLFFVVDEYTDLQSGDSVRETIDIVRDALAHPEKPRPEGEILLGQVVKEFWQRAIRNSTPAAQKHFLSAFRDHLASIIVQAGDRDRRYIRTVNEYIHMRRDNIGIRPSFFPGSMNLDIPMMGLLSLSIMLRIWSRSTTYVFREPSALLAGLVYSIADSFVSQDVASYNKEQASDDADCNIVTILMHQFQTDYTGAVEWVARHHAELERAFLSLAQELPVRLRRSGVVVTPYVQDQLSQFVRVLGNWPRANDAWTFESYRYFGSKGAEVQQTRVVKRTPKKIVDKNAAAAVPHPNAPVNVAASAIVAVN
ncbi:terpenoid synthase [Auriculariales sp. MPI-PUGE-AT-0066]|nr:terpenoid synthase [Auriculariales sp. MPI-PUGE-AT-0066]